MPRRPAPGRVPGSATPRPRVGAAALTVAALALAACAGTPGTAAGDAPAGAARTALTAQQFAAEQIPLPPQATTLQEAAEVVAVAEPRGAFPALIAAATQTADRPAGVRLWHGDVQGERFYALDAVPQVDGDVTTVCADQDARHAVVAGGWWDGSALHPFLWRADESGTWTDVPLVDDVARGIVRAVAVDSGRAWAVVELPDRADALLTVDLASGSSSAVPLPVTASGAERRITGVAAQGGTVVILAEEGPPEALLRPVGYVSADAGATISGPHAIGEGRAGDSAVGIVEAAGEFVVAGGAGATPAEARRTLWRSPDGLTWRPEAVVLPKSLAPDVLPTDWLTSVTSDPDGALSVGLSGGTFAAGVNLADGSYLAGETDAVDSTALALRVGPDPQDSVLLFWAEGGIAEYFFTSDGQVLDQTVVHTTRRTRIMVPDRSDGSRLLASRDALREVDGVRVQSPMDTDLVRRGGEIALADWRPEEAAGWSDLRLGTSDGRTVLAGTARTGGGWRVGALVSDDDDTGWTPADGVTTGDDALPTALGHADGAWYLAASVGDLDLDNHLFAPEVWTSRDGSTWEPLGDAFPVDGDDAEVYAFCSAPDGGALAVGTTLAPDGTWAPSVWRGEGDRWRTTVLSEGGEGWIDGCQDGGAEVILTGEQAGLTRTWRVAGDAGPVEAQTLAPDEIRGAPLSLAVAGGPGGWVAGGYLDTPEHVGAVLWFSSDGERWDWVALPGRALSTAPEVALDGADLLVFGDVGHSPVAWVVRGLVDAG